MDVIPWHRRLEARVALGISLLIGGSLALLLVFANSIVRTNALDRAAADLQAARVAFYHLVENRGESAAVRLRLVTELPVFRAMLPNPDLAGDANTFFAMADEYRRALSANFLIVTNAAGAWITNPGWIAYTRPPEGLTAAIADARAGAPRRSIVAHESHLYLIVSEPARFADEVLGTVVAGYQLDDTVARELALTSRCEVSFLVAARLSGSSLSASRQQSLIDLVRRDPDALGRFDAPAELRPLADARYVSGTYPVTADSTPSVGRLVLLQDWAPTQAFVDQIRNGVLLTGGIMFLLALAVGLIVSRRMTRPLTDITRITGEVAAGNWDRRVPVRGGGEIAALAASFNDMTASLSHWHAEAQTKAAALMQAQKMEAIGRLAGGVAHDFNNLLTAIRGYAELLVDDLDEHDPRRDDAAQIIKAAETAGSLTRQLLAFSRKQILAPKVVNLGHIVRGMEKMLRRLIGEDVDLTVTADPGVWSVRADPGQIEQVVMNLALNARDAMPMGGRLSIHAANAPSSGGEGDRVCITVSDTGVGMDKATLANIFEPFFTTKDEGHGTGLGLATVDGIVEQSGGSITAESDVGRGSTFRVFLPRVAEPPPGAEPQQAPAREAVAVETVLLVEDEPGVRRFAHHVLARQGYHVLESACGDEALLEASRHSGTIHLLLTDVVMPGMSGRVLWERLSVLRPELRVLLVSGYTDDAVVRHGIKESGLPYLQKPFSVASLLEAVRRALASHRAHL